MTGVANVFSALFSYCGWVKTASHFSHCLSVFLHVCVQHVCVYMCAFICAPPHIHLYMSVTSPATSLQYLYLHVSMLVFPLLLIILCV